MGLLLQQFRITLVGRKDDQVMAAFIDARNRLLEERDIKIFEPWNFADQFAQIGFADQEYFAFRKCTDVLE
jgi:hypothetical protein